MQNKSGVKSQKKEPKTKNEFKKLILDNSAAFKFIQKCPHRNVINLKFMTRK